MYVQHEVPVTDSDIKQWIDDDKFMWTSNSSGILTINLSCHNYYSNSINFDIDSRSWKVEYFQKLQKYYRLR